MEVMEGSCRLGLWFVRVYWNNAAVHRVRFARTGIDGPVPSPIRMYCAGKTVDPASLDSTALFHEGVSSRIYHEVRNIPYGSTRTYGEIARLTGTVPRVVGQAMARNPTPLVIPCHRVVGAHGIGGFSPDLEIKEILLSLEQRGAAAGKKMETFRRERAEHWSTDPK